MPTLLGPQGESWCKMIFSSAAVFHSGVSQTSIFVKFVNEAYLQVRYRTAKAHALNHKPRLSELEKSGQLRCTLGNRQSHPCANARQQSSMYHRARYGGGAF